MIIGILARKIVADILLPIVLVGLEAAALAYSAKVTADATVTTAKIEAETKLAGADLLAKIEGIELELEESCCEDDDCSCEDDD